MYIIQTVNAKQFSLDGIPYFKNYISRVTTNGKLSIFNCYDSRDVLVEFTDADQFEVNGVTYTDVAALQAALINVLYTRGASGGGSVGDLQEVTDNGATTTNEILVTDEGGNYSRLAQGFMSSTDENADIEAFLLPNLLGVQKVSDPTKEVKLLFPTPTSSRLINIPDESGTMATREWVQPQVQSANFTAENGRSYHTVATCTVTDPTPVEGKGFEVLVVNGTTTVGGTAYNVVGTVIKRVFHSGAWSSRVYITQTAINAALAGKLDATASSNIAETTTDGTASSGTANTVSSSVLIPAGRVVAGNILDCIASIKCTGTAGNRAVRFYVNTTPDLTGSPILVGALTGIAGTVLQVPLQRFLTVKVTNGTGAGTEIMNTSNNVASQYGTSAAAVQTTSIDWTIDQHLIVAVQASNAGDSLRSTFLKVRR